MERCIFHVDVNSAFLSWEAVRRVARGEPDLRSFPSAVGGDRDARRGVILAKSIPAKAFGVSTGEPIASALRKCPELVIVSPDFAWYETNSRAFLDICRKYAPVVEQYSIDECFLDMSGTFSVYGEPTSIAQVIKNEIRDSLGFTVNVGVGSNKLLAKMASDFEKPDRVHTLFAWEIPQKMWVLPVRELFSVGSATANRLERASIRTIGDLAKAPLSVICSLVGTKLGEQLHRFANGEDPSPVSATPESAKGYSNSVTLPRDITSVDEAHEVLLSLADNVTSRMRADGMSATCIAVTVRGSDFQDHSHQRKLERSTDITAEVFQISQRLLEELWHKRTPLRLLGLSLTGLTEGAAEQISFFPDAERERAKRVDRAIDSIRTEFGYDSIRRGIGGLGTSEHGKFEKKRNG